MSRVIDGPEVKTDYADISGINGVLDYSDVMGLYYKNKSVKIKLRKIANSSYDFGEMRRRYLGQRIDFAFDDEPEYFGGGYYHVGRVVKISDDYRADFRTVELDIDTEPFKRPEAGDTTFTVPVYEYSSLLTGAEELIIPVYTAEVDTYGTYASNNGTQITIAPKDATQGDSSRPPMVMIPLFVSASADDANRYTFQAPVSYTHLTLPTTPYV